MYMNYNQYNSYKERVLNDLYNRKTPNMEEYLTDKFTPDDFADFIKEMEADGLINNVRYIHAGEAHESIIPSFEHVVVTDKGRDIVEA